MKAFWNILKHKYFKIAVVVSILLVLPLFLFASYQTQELRGKAEAATTLSFSPTSSKTSLIAKKVGESFYLDLMLNPGKNLVSVLKVDIRYDSSIMSISSTNPLVVNEVVFPEILEGPVFTDGRVQIVLTVGQDHTRAISSEARALTLNFMANSRTKITTIDIGENTAIYSVGIDDLSGENVFSSYTPAYIKIDRLSRGEVNPGKGNKK